ncbi:LacI family DNA-binding transcriptional regulator [Brachybacterium hainanense]|uniref:LacI family DNA-binding transcriptional regulator n=1 Tax=Brachybacterium hainanense TaxID=1541174 RepID=A0ABV6R756_9MICO
MPPRVTITDIAREAGVSKTAVSLALNDKPGVSEDTRMRVREVAGRLAWRPHYAARALSRSRTGAFGMALARSAETVGAESFFMSLFAGIERRLADHDRALLLQLVDDPAHETQVVEQWAGEHRVDGVMLIDLRLEDPRIPALARLDLPTAAIAPEPLGRGISTLVTDDCGRMRLLLEHLLAQGHRSIRYLSGPEEFLHVRNRTAAFRRMLAEAGGRAQVRVTDYSVRAARALAAEFAEEGVREPERRPTAVVCDNDLLAVRLMVELPHVGVRVPRDLAVAAMEDSLLCTLTSPPVTALGRDIAADGSRLVDLLAQSVEGPAVDAAAGPSTVLVRESTAQRPQEVTAGR